MSPEYLKTRGDNGAGKGERKNPRLFSDCPPTQAPVADSVAPALTPSSGSSPAGCSWVAPVASAAASRGGPWRGGAVRVCPNRSTGIRCWRQRLPQSRRWRRANPSAAATTGRKRPREPRALRKDYHSQRPPRPCTCALAAGTAPWRPRRWCLPRSFGNAVARASGPV